jgi:hypothetical protein
MVATAAVCPCYPHAPHPTSACPAEAPILPGTIALEIAQDALVMRRELLWGILERMLAMHEQIDQQTIRFELLRQQLPENAFPDQHEVRPFWQHLQMLTRQLVADRGALKAAEHAVNLCETCGSCRCVTKLIDCNKMCIGYGAVRLSTLLATLHACPVDLKDADCAALELLLRSVAEDLPTSWRTRSGG